LAPALFLDDIWMFWVAGATFVAFAVAYGLKVGLASAARKRVTALYRGLLQALAAAEAINARCLEEAKAFARRQLAKFKARQGRGLREAAAADKRTQEEQRKRHEDETTAVETKYRPKLAAIEERRVRDLQQAEEKYKRRRVELDDRTATTLKQV